MYLDLKLKVCTLASDCFMNSLRAGCFKRSCCGSNLCLFVIVSVSVSGQIHPNLNSDLSLAPQSLMWPIERWFFWVPFPLLEFILGIWWLFFIFAVSSIMTEEKVQFCSLNFYFFFPFLSYSLGC